MYERHRDNGSAPVVIFYTDNGIGLGHLTRQAAIANRARGAFRPSFLTMSAGYMLMRQLGLPAEYFPSYGALGIPKQQWEPLVARRLLEAIRLTGASAVVVDHISPPRIFESLRASTTGVKFLWSRRGMWQPDKNRAALDAGKGFDLVVEPGDLASPLDQGATVHRRGEVISTDPIVLTDTAEQLPGDEARDQLRIPRSGPAYLINLGDPSPAEIARLISHARSVVEIVSDGPAHFFSPLHPLHGDRIPKVRRVAMRPVYPVSRFLNAFDGVISSAGYNSFHETVASGLPAVFVPHRGARIDDQVRRAEFAALSGRAHWAPDVYDPSFHVAVRRMLRPPEKDIAKRVSAVLGEMRGARQFADILADVAITAQLEASGGRARSDYMADGPDLAFWPPELSDTHCTLVIALDHDDEQLQELVATAHSPHLGRLVVLVRHGAPGPLFRKKFVFESAMTESEWSALGRHGYRSYLEARITGMAERYGPRHIITATPGQDITAE